MRNPKKMGWAAVTVMGLAAGAARADDDGIVRISDRPAPSAIAASMASTIGMNNNAVAVTGDAAYVDGAGVDGACGRSGGGWYSPTTGFRPPGTAPVYRDAIIYYRFWPNKWYGEPGFNLRPQFPMVYMPTDTTQLGFYYARVPQWLPNPSMYPPPPRPADWHRRVVYGAGGSCAADGGAFMGVTASGPMVAPEKVPSQAPVQSVPPTSPTLAPPPSASIDSGPIHSEGVPSRVLQNQPAQPNTAPGAPTQNPELQPAAASANRHWLLDDLRDFTRRRATPIPTEASPNP